jgi:hypothetical protein
VLFTSQELKQGTQMKGWNQFGVIDTIYEEEREFSSTSSSSLSPSFSSSPPPSIHSIVNAWLVLFLSLSLTFYFLRKNSLAYSIFFNLNKKNYDI